jgi:hypothetical protein
VKGLTAILIFAGMAILAPATANAAPRVCSKSVIEQKLLEETDVTQTQLDEGGIDDVICGDLTGDGGAEALFTVGSGGSQGNAAVGVIQGFSDNSVGMVMFYDEHPGVAIARRNSTTFEIGFPRFSRNDADCCPSAYRIWRYQYLPKRSPTFVHTKSSTVKRLPSRFRG